MLDKPISPLRQRMIDDMTARRFNEHTQRDYVRNVRMFAAFLGRSPDPAAKEDLRRFQLHRAKQQMSAGSINAAIAALRFFFAVTLERPDLVLPLTTVNKPRRAPVVLSQEEVARLLEAAPGLKQELGSVKIRPCGSPSTGTPTSKDTVNATKIILSSILLHHLAPHLKAKLHDYNLWCVTSTMSNPR